MIVNVRLKPASPADLQTFEQRIVRRPDNPVRVDRLNADMGRAGFQMGIDPRPDRIEIAPGEGGIDKPVAAAIVSSACCWR